MTGQEIRTARLFSNGKPIVVAIDHGQYFGPIPGLVDLAETARQVASADAILMSPFVLSRVKPVFYRKDGPSLILRVNWTTALCMPWQYREAHTHPTLEVEEALAMGADLVLANLTLQSGCEKTDAENVKVFTKIARQKERAGLPLIGEVIPLIPLTETERLHRHIKEAVRIAWELGADLIKTYYTGPRFSEVIAGVPIPVFALGGAKFKNEADALALARKAFQAGAAGLVFGRNVIQARKPDRFIQQLKSAAG